MTVEFTPKKEGCFCFSVANETFFEMCNTSAIKTFIGEQHTNDPIDVDGTTADLCGDALDLWTPPKGWFSDCKENEGKAMFKNFFKSCDGFKTH